MTRPSRSGTVEAEPLWLILAGGHTGRILYIAFDKTKVISCGEDYRIFIWIRDLFLVTSIVVSFIQDVHIVQDQLRLPFTSTHYSQHHRSLPKMSVLEQRPPAQLLFQNEGKREAQSPHLKLHGHRDHDELGRGH